MLTRILIGNELRENLRRWISPPDPSNKYNKTCEAQHEGTAAWCTKSKTFADWKVDGPLLWIHGKRTRPIIFWVLSAVNCLLVYSWLWEDLYKVRGSLGSSVRD